MTRLQRTICLLFAIFALGWSHESPPSSAVVELTDANFEHLTQASTGATTGDWLIAFVAPWCGHCKRMAGTWEELATELKGHLSVARVDATANQYTARRFDVRAYPTIKLVRQGKVYSYEGNRALDDLKEFALSGGKGKEATPVPPPVGFLQIVANQLTNAAQDIKLLTMRKPESIAAVFSLGLLVGVILASAIFYCFEKNGNGNGNGSGSGNAQRGARKGNGNGPAPAEGKKKQ